MAAADDKTYSGTCNLCNEDKKTQSCELCAKNKQILCCESCLKIHDNMQVEFIFTANKINETIQRVLSENNVQYSIVDKHISVRTIKEEVAFGEILNNVMQQTQKNKIIVLDIHGVADVDFETILPSLKKNHPDYAIALLSYVGRHRSAYLEALKYISMYVENGTIDFGFMAFGRGTGKDANTFTIFGGKASVIKHIFSNVTDLLFVDDATDHVNSSICVLLGIKNDKPLTNVNKLLKYYTYTETGKRASLCLLDEHAFRNQKDKENTLYNDIKKIKESMKTKVGKELELKEDERQIEEHKKEINSLANARKKKFFPSNLITELEKLILKQHSVISQSDASASAVARSQSGGKMFYVYKSNKTNYINLS
jgi:hypothetical protein